jgi:hypothetical protein
MTAIISRADAKAAGLRKYFTGKPCKRGHVAEHYVTGPCVVCNAERNSTSEMLATKRAAQKTPEGRAKNLARVLRFNRGVKAGDVPDKPDDGRCECCGEVAPLCWDHDHDLFELGVNAGVKMHRLAGEKMHQ